jgi:outer membrane protein assembly factor BamB
MQAKIIYRNVAAVSAIFIVAFSIMIVVNYFQVRSAPPLQTEIMETLKQINEDNPNNPALQEQIRQLDLLARKAYFISHDRLIAGIYILLGMTAVLLLCLRGYYAGYRNIPDKEIDPVDEWADKTKARRYVVWGTCAVAVIALGFAILTSPYLKTKKTQLAVEQKETDNPETDIPADTETVSPSVPSAEEDSITVQPAAETPETPGKPSEEPTPQPVVSKVTHNAFRGNNSNGISSAKNVPVKWNPATGENIAWKHDIPRKGNNSPVINGNRVFFTGADSEARELYCYNLATGDKLWSLKAVDIPGSPSQMPEISDDAGLASSTVATNGTQVCAIFATGDLICADMDGKRLWAKNLGVPKNHYAYVASLLTFGNLLIVQYDNENNPRVMALDIATGAERWSKSRQEKYSNWASPMIAYIDGKPQLILIGCPSISAYNPGNGEQIWRVECLSGEPTASACSANGIVFGAGEYSKLIAINAADGTTLWDANDYLPEVASPVATKDNVYIATSYGVAVAFDAQTGEIRKEHELGDGFYSSPMIVEGKIFLFNNSGKMHIFSANNDFKLLSAFETGEKTIATPAFTDGKIVVRTEKSIYCVAAM